MKFSKLFLMMLLAALVGFLGQACGDDDDDDDSTTDDGPIEMCGTIIGFGSDTPVPNMKIVALDNDTAEVIPGTEKKAKGDGTVCFEDLPGERIGFKVFGVEGEFVDTYQFNIRTDAKKETIWIVDMTTFTMSPKLAQVPIDPEKAIAAGGAYWLDEQGNEYPVECGTVEAVSGGADVRYFSDATLPTTIENQPSLNRANGYWIAANMKAGKVTLNLKAGDEVVGSTTFWAYPGNAISIGNIEVDEKYTENPGKCE